MRISHFAYLLLLLLCCCKKPKTTTIPAVAFTYTAVYDSVITMRANTTHYFDFSINVLTGDIQYNKLNCSITNVPANMTVYPPSYLVGHTLGGVYVFKADSLMPVGYDTLHFVLSDSATGTKTHNLIVHIIPPPDYAPLLAGTYDSSNDFCVPNYFNYTSVVSTVPGTPYEIKISNIRNLGTTFVVSGWVSTTISIPVQTSGAYTIWGAGTYNRDPLTGNKYYEMIINDTIVNGADTQTCIAHIQRK